MSRVIVKAIFDLILQDEGAIVTAKTGQEINITSKLADSLLVQADPPIKIVQIIEDAPKGKKD